MYVYRIQLSSRVGRDAEQLGERLSEVLLTGNRAENLRRVMECFALAVRGYRSVGLTEVAEGLAEKVVKIAAELAEAQGEPNAPTECSGEARD